MDSLADLIPKNDSTWSGSFQNNIRKHVPFQGGPEDVVDPMPFSKFSTYSPNPSSRRTSILLDFIRYYERIPPGLDLDNPNLLSLLYYPISWVASNWVLYVLLVNRYYKLYEHSVKRSGAETVLEARLLDLQRWRRRMKQSISKLNLITAFIRLHMPSSPEQAGPIPHSQPAPSDLSEMSATLLSDYCHIVDEIKEYKAGVDFLISISTTMSQLLMTQRSVQEAINIRRLTYIALFSAPIGLVAAVFSVSAEFLPGHSGFWIFIITAVLVTMCVVGAALMPASFLQIASESWYSMMKLCRTLRGR